MNACKDSGARYGRRVDISQLLAPRSIVIVGVKVAEPESWGHRVVRVLLEGGFDGRLQVVHPRDDFPGVDTTRALADCSSLDLVVICVRAQPAVALVREARALGAKAAVVFASEFAEFGEDGRRLEAELAEAAGDMPLLGPNCLGFSNRIDNVKISVAPFLNRPLLPAGPVALVAQSGALGVVLTRCVENAGVGYSHFVSVGNETCLTAPMIARELIERDDVETVILYLETLRDPGNLARAAMRAHDLGKRIVLLQAGLSAAGRRAALSHTAAIAGDAAMVEALCRDFGIVRLADDDAVKPVLTALANGWSLPESPRVAVLSNSGGAAAVLADRLSVDGARVEPFSPDTQARIRAVKLSGAGDTNPIDIGGGWEATLDRVAPTLAILEAEPDIDAVLVYYAFGEMTVAPLAAVAQMCARLSKPAIFVWQIAPPEGLELVTAPGVVATSMAEGVRDLLAMSVLKTGPVSRWSMRPSTDIGLSPINPGQTTLAELESTEILESLGMNTVPSVSASPSQCAALAAACAANGWSEVAVKANAHDIPHRARSGLVRVGVALEALPDALIDMARRLDAASNDPQRRILVQPLIRFDQEIGVGGLVDPAFGPILVVGPGGGDIESAQHERHALLLNTDIDTHTAFADRIERSYDLAKGAFKPVIEAIDTILRSGKVAEIDINPMVRDSRGGLVALDALMVPEREA
ncbi:acetate--CoA ligase family protein [Nitratireductor sp. StC3]|uniref:acetate--CoA ligase family protein n=1 Tax=Nitratireductor sp. StC3 TaxID=2126741 RepID=UPI001FE23940|nr:acetate--CoA ligase family protein [Nitratireductor sp. StC3]